MKRRQLACAVTAIYCIASHASAYATTMDEVVSRLNALEAANRRLAQENAEFRNRLKATNVGSAATSSKQVAKEVSREVARQIEARRAAEPASSSSRYPSMLPFGPVSTSVDNRVAHAFLEKEKGDKLNFRTPNGEILVYGNLDVSFDATTKGIGNLQAEGAPPIGNVGWLPAISGNKSFLGVRGFQNIGSTPNKFVYQLETLVDVSAQSGVAETNSNQSNVVRGALTSRNSFIGVSNPDFGIVRIGKTDTPYYQSTARMNPFSGMLGDYSVIMGNTGGDNRVEFGTRLDHSIWYESPDVHGFKFSALFSPGQNRGYQNDNIAAGESDCTGGNIPGSGGVGGLQANSCSDGSFGDAVSASLVYDRGPLYAVAAYERHFQVNRSSDIGQLGGGGVGIYANAPYFLIQGDTADEDAAKIGVQYKFKTGTTVSGIVESMHRYVPDYLAFQNERTRFGTWLAVEQELTPVDHVAFGWAHAFRTPGDPGQHDSAFFPAPFQNESDVAGGPGVNNTANLLTAVYKRTLMPGLTWYTNVAATLNGPYAHYDLGAGGHGVTTDCHDGFGADGGVGSNPHCWAGGQVLGVSSGLNLNF